MNNNKRLALSIIYVVIGIVLIALSIAEILDSSFYSGMGGGLIAVGVLQIIRNIKYRSNQEYKERVDIEENDERNRFIHMKSWSWTGYIIVLVNAVGSIVATVMNQDLIRSYCLYSVCVILIVYWISYMIVSKKY